MKPLYRTYGDYTFSLGEVGWMCPIAYMGQIFLLIDGGHIKIANPYLRCRNGTRCKFCSMCSDSSLEG